MREPVIDKKAYIAKSADVCGDVTIGPMCSVWNHATIRGDRDSITIGEGSNIQDNAVVHEEKGLPVTIGKYVTVGHSAIVHGSFVDDYTLIGMHATIMNGCHIGKNCIIGAGALVTENTVIPDDSLVLGMPAKVVKKVSDEQKAHFKENAMRYVQEAMELLED
ncbi:Carbonic anhydrase or acetyltransferase, isoleucine patch superfamily [Butyrivibrio fibrisolvens DSM 3071]|uniref:Carbonic anhydrase or acetyltransferase, isoleucine patch superfamily n=1 Tax=Butyrivibrio fibrisolvens DSM 3071 TaxID=1121131 RepID=A0A1M5ZW16_BUTFI|nr:gamma carbonic anhydrase family protein [Butyrivibrio fibrisolvens]SHI28487.1 Carbonic anhydrase or acetyltransferase, isoleucine patch superfamily [Butyrivibrio fibrisolvens DSM 3071]